MLFSRQCIGLSALTVHLGLAVAASDAASNICGQVLNSADTLTARDVYSCLTSTPFHADVAIQLLDYWKTTLKFQSTLAYLQSPPRAYQQPPINVLRSFDLIRAQIDIGVFDNQYAFETAVQALLQATHDGSVFLAGSVIGVFTFGAPENLVAVSSDGVSIPKVYVAEDLAGNPDASPITKINGEIAEDFLAVFASENSMGYIEPHSDWNALMYSGAGQVRGLFGSITETPFYPGDNFSIEFANGTSAAAVPWQAYNKQGYDLPSIQTGEDFYNFFVLGKMPQSSATDIPSTTVPSETTFYASSTVPADVTTTEDSAASATTEASSDDDSVRGWDVPYPAVADLVQDNLGSGGFLTGYFLNDSKTGVISIPSFELTDETADSFSTTISSFLQQSKERGMEKIVIDLQQNFGGEILLATDTFSQFFPTIRPFSGMRTRSFDLADDIGNTYENVYLDWLQNPSSQNGTFISDLQHDIFFANTLLNVNTNANFTTWGEYFGPHPDRGDQFSTVFAYDTATDTLNAATDGVTLTTATQKAAQPPYDAKDIVILTDGACSAVCDVFVEMMHHEAGVRTVVVGGLPQYGPMQARGSGRGAQVYTSDSLDFDFIVATYLNETLSSILPQRTGDAVDQSRLVFNFADQIRPGENVPLQFIYEAADCRIFWKPETFNNYVALWEHAAEASFRNGSLCVPRSAEHNNTMITDIWGPSPEQLTAWAATNPAWVAKNNASISATSGLAQEQYDTSLHMDKRSPWSSLPVVQDPIVGQSCFTDRNCGNSNKYVCVRTTLQCGFGLPTKVGGMCKLACQGSSFNVQKPCDSGTANYPRRTDCAQGSYCPQTCFCDVNNAKRDDDSCKAVATTVIGPAATVAYKRPKQFSSQPRQRRGLMAWF